MFLSLFQEKVLVYRFIRKRCLLSFYKLIFFNIKFIFKMVLKFKCVDIRFNDFLNEGFIGFINSILRYNPEKNCSLRSFSFLCIRCSFVTYVKRRSVYISPYSVDLLSFGNINSWYTNFLRGENTLSINPGINDFTLSLKYENYYLSYKLRSAIKSFNVVLQVIVFSNYFFKRSLTVCEICFFLNVSKSTMFKLRKNILNFLYLLSF
jgi:hypothetical protein